MEVDYLNYSLQELHEAWMTIDDYAYPERAITVYQLLKMLRLKRQKIILPMHLLRGSCPCYVISVGLDYMTQALAIYYWKKVVQG